MYLSGTSGQDGMTDIIFRGQIPGKSSANILILVDGSSINMTTDSGNFNLNLVPVETIERIEVIPNGGNVLYGEGAVGGVINIITKNPKNKKFYGQAGIERGNFSRNYLVNTGSQITDRLSIDVTYLDRLLDGYRHHSERKTEYFVVNSKYRFDNGNLSLGYSTADMKAKFSGAVDKKDKRKSNSYTEADENMDIFKLKYDTQLTKNLSFMINSDYKHRTYLSINANTKKISTEKDMKNYYINPQFKYSYGEKSYLVIGGDYSDGTCDNGSVSHLTFTSATRESIGAFIINNTKYNNFQFSQGFRQQRMKYDLDDQSSNKGTAKDKTFNKTFNAQAYELTGTYFTSDTSSIFLSYNRAFRAPNTSEGGSWESKNMDIQASDTFELGGKALWNNIYFSGSIFHSETDKEIFYLTKASGEIGGNYNFPDTIIRNGIELASEQYFNKFTLKESFNYIHHKIDGGKFNENKVPGLPNIIASIGFNYEPIDKLNISTTLFYRGSAYAQYDYKNSLGKQGGYSEVNLNINYTLENGLIIYGGINNLFDKEYYYAKASTSSNTLSYYAGNKRSYFLGFKYSF